MKLITWNCAGRLAKTAGALFAESPDIAIVQECLKSTMNNFTPAGYETLWFGDEDIKGVAVFWKSEWQIQQLASPSHTWVIPLSVTGPEKFTLIAVHSCPPENRSQAYVKLIREALVANEQWFKNGPVVIAGDFNSNTEFDQVRVQHHTSLVADLETLGVTSIYHSRNKEAQGQESQKTFQTHWGLEKARNPEKEHHIDYIFVPHQWLSRITHFEVGDGSKWYSLSDHLPLIATFQNLN
jgi:endonuclease/exonuclease/phosphatase family metal-dependent hydrolase